MSSNWSWLFEFEPLTFNWQGLALHSFISISREFCNSFMNSCLTDFSMWIFWGQSRFQKCVIAWKRLKATALTTQVSQHKNSNSYCIKSSLLVRKLLLTATSSNIHFEVITSLHFQDISKITLELKQQSNICLEY